MSVAQDIIRGGHYGNNRNIVYGGRYLSGVCYSVCCLSVVEYCNVAFGVWPVWPVFFLRV